MRIMKRRNNTHFFVDLLKTLLQKNNLFQRILARDKFLRLIICKSSLQFFVERLNYFLLMKNELFLLFDALMNVADPIVKISGILFYILERVLNVRTNFINLFFKHHWKNERGFCLKSL